MLGADDSKTMENEDCSVLAAAVEDIYISILRMAPPHRPFEVLPV